MQCSAARCQPACFSGRSTVPHWWGSPRSTELCLKALARAAARHSRVGASASGVRGSIHDFDRHSGSVSESYEDIESVDGTSFSGPDGQGTALAVEFRARETRVRDAGRQADREGPDRDSGELSYGSAALDELAGASTFDRAAEVLRDSIVEDSELVMLSLGLCKSTRSAEPQLREELRSHAAILLLGQAIDERIQRLRDEDVVIMLCALESMEARGCQVSGTQELAEELSRRLLDRELRISSDQTTWLLDSFCSSPNLRPFAASVVVPIARRLQLGELTASQLHSVVYCLACTGQTRRAAKTLQLACQKLRAGLTELSSRQLYQLVLRFDVLAPYIPQQMVKAVLDAFLRSDPKLEGSCRLRALLLSCRKLPAHLTAPLKEAAAGALARQAASLQTTEVEEVLRALGRLRSKLSRATQRQLQEALEGSLFQADAQVATPRAAVATLVALDRLRLGLPKSYLDSFCDSLASRGLCGEGGLGGGVSPRDVASLVRCLGARKHPVQEPRRLFQLIERTLGEAGPVDIAHLASGMSHIAAAVPLPPSLWEAVDRAAARLLPRFDVKSICMLLYGFGRARMTPSASLLPALSLCSELAADFRVRDFSDVLWSLAMMRVTDPAAMTVAAELVAHCERLISSESETRLAVRDLAATAWAVASLDELPMDRFPTVELISRKARPSNGMNGYDIAQVLWACCKLDAVPPFLPRYTERIEQLALKLQPVHVTTILWAYARLERHPGIELMEALLSSVTTSVHTFDPQGVSNALWACAQLRHHPGALMAAVRADLARRGAEYSASDWSGILYAFTWLGEDPAELLQSVHHLVEEQRVEVDTHLAATLVWAAAVFDRLREPAALSMTERLQRVPPHELRDDSRICLHQATLLACLTEQWSPRDLPPGLRPPGEPKAWLAELLTEDQSNETNRQYSLIGKALHGLKLHQLYNYQLGSGTRDGRTLKLSIVLKGPWGTPRKVAVELLSPKKLTVNTHQPLARALYRQACLSACGLDVLLLPYSEWEAAVGKGIAEEYLARKLHALLNKM